MQKAIMQKSKKISMEITINENTMTNKTDQCKHRLSHGIGGKHEINLCVKSVRS